MATKAERRETQRKKEKEAMDKGKKIKLLQQLTQRRAEAAAKLLMQDLLPRKLPEADCVVGDQGFIRKAKADLTIDLCGGVDCEG